MKMMMMIGVKQEDREFGWGPMGQKTFFQLYLVIKEEKNHVYNFSFLISDIHTLSMSTVYLYYAQ